MGGAKSIWIYGINPVKEFLAKDKVKQVAITKKLYQRLNKEQEFISLFNKVDIKFVEKFEKFLPDGVNHQNIAALIVEPEKLTEKDFLQRKDLPNKLVILDQITDIGNVGNIIRSAIAFGIRDLFIPENNAASDYAAIARSSSGLSINMNIYSVNNLNKLISLLQEREFWCAGLAGEAKSDIKILNKFEKLALIMGSEGKGIRDLVKKNCDLLVKIPMHKNAESLNVANAAAIVFYELFS